MRALIISILRTNINYNLKDVDTFWYVLFILCTLMYKDFVYKRVFVLGINYALNEANSSRQTYLIKVTSIQHIKKNIYYWLLLFFLHKKCHVLMSIQAWPEFHWKNITVLKVKKINQINLDYLFISRILSQLIVSFHCELKAFSQYYAYITII